MSEIREFRLIQRVDAQGNCEEFTSDMSLILGSEKTHHLTDDGLPRIGSRITPGMILIAKIGATEEYDRRSLPDDMELLTSDESTLARKYARMFHDGSLYAPDDLNGTVRNAFFTEDDGRRVAVVEVEV